MFWLQKCAIYFDSLRRKEMALSPPFQELPAWRDKSRIASLWWRKLALNLDGEILASKKTCFRWGKGWQSLGVFSTLEEEDGRGCIWEELASETQVHRGGAHNLEEALVLYHYHHQVASSFVSSIRLIKATKVNRNWSQPEKESPQNQKWIYVCQHVPTFFHTHLWPDSVHFV